MDTLTFSQWPRHSPTGQRLSQDDYINALDWAFEHMQQQLNGINQKNQSQTTLFIYQLMRQSIYGLTCQWHQANDMQKSEGPFIEQSQIKVNDPLFGFFLLQPMALSLPIQSGSRKTKLQQIPAHRLATLASHAISLSIPSQPYGSLINKCALLPMGTLLMLDAAYQMDLFIPKPKHNGLLYNFIYQLLDCNQQITLRHTLFQAQYLAPLAGQWEELNDFGTTPKALFEELFSQTLRYYKGLKLDYWQAVNEPELSWPDWHAQLLKKQMPMIGMTHDFPLFWFYQHMQHQAKKFKLSRVLETYPPKHENPKKVSKL